MIDSETATIEIYDWFAHRRESLQDLDARRALMRAEGRLHRDFVRSEMVKRFVTDSLMLCRAVCSAYSHFPQDDLLERTSASFAELCSQAWFNHHSQDLAHPSAMMVPLSYEQYLRVVRELAYWLHRNGLPSVEEELLNWKLERVCATFNVEKTISVPSVRCFLADIGLVENNEEGAVSFASPLLWEYYAAQGAIAGSDTGFLVNSAHRPHFFSVLVFAAALATRSDCEIILSGIVARGDREAGNREALYRLAARCLEEVIEVGDDVCKAVQARVEDESGAGGLGSEEK